MMVLENVASASRQLFVNFWALWAREPVDPVKRKGPVTRAFAGGR